MAMQRRESNEMVALLTPSSACTMLLLADGESVAVTAVATTLADPSVCVEGADGAGEAPPSSSAQSVQSHSAQDKITD